MQAVRKDYGTEYFVAGWEEMVPDRGGVERADNSLDPFF
jgi:hypothetical protein